MASGGFRDLDVYRRALDTVVEVHKVVATFPDFGRCELAAQMRRASKSVPANIAEGDSRRRSARDFANFLTMALASANEMEVHLEIAYRLGYLAEPQWARLLDEYDHIGQQLTSLVRSWRYGRPTRREKPATSDEGRG